MAQRDKIELGFALNAFGKPQEYSGAKAWAMQCMQLILMEPSTYPSNPTLGIGFKNYDYTQYSDRVKLENAINTQIPRFFPDMPFTRVSISYKEDSSGNLIAFFIFSFLSSDETEDTVVVAAEKKYNYIDFAVAL